MQSPPSGILHVDWGNVCVCTHTYPHPRHPHPYTYHSSPIPKLLHVCQLAQFPETLVWFSFGWLPFLVFSCPILSAHLGTAPVEFFLLSIDSSWLLFKRSISRGTGLSSIPFPSVPLLLRLYMLWVSLSSLILFVIDLYRNDYLHDTVQTWLS